MSRSRQRLVAVARGNRGLFPASPCVSICTVDDDDVCLGCGRTLDEITQWSGYSREQQWEIIDALVERTGADVAE